MKLASVEVIPYALPFKEPYVTARGSLERREMVLLRLRDPELSAPARCAALTALLDLRGRRAGTGSRPHAPGAVPCNATLVAGEPAAVAEDALRWAADGFATFKLKLGAGDDVGQVRAVRQAVGPEARIPSWSSSR